MSFRRRTFPEVLDSLLTSVTKGVAAESQPFPAPGQTGQPFSNNLQQPPVASVVSVYGSKDGGPHLFRKDTDYKLVDQKTIAWQSGAELPDAGTLFYVNYYPQAALPVITDIYTGSVVRTLAETVALEIAQTYAQLEAVYQAGFIDTATGKSLDNVVALLGISRIKGGRAEGVVVFSRAAGSTGTINIPTGTRLITKDGKAEYETTQDVSMSSTESTIRVPIRDLQVRDTLPADSLVVLPVPIAAIGGVTNPSPTSISTREETDDELRARAKSILHGSERATLGAIRQAIALQGIAADVDEIPDTPGRLKITLHADNVTPELYQRLHTAIDDVRPAGVLYTLDQGEAPRKVNLSLRLTTDPNVPQPDLRAAQNDVRAKIEDYFARLPVKEEGSINKIIGLALSIPQIKDISIDSATWTVNGAKQDVLDTQNGRLKIGGFTTALGDLEMVDPNVPTQVNVTVTYPKGANPPDKPAIQSAVSKAVNYLNILNATQLAANASAAEKAKRQITFGKLLYVVPLPIPGKAGANTPAKPVVSLEEIDNPQGQPPALPSENDVKPYIVSFTFTLQSGLSKALLQAADSYSLSSLERLSVVGVETKERDSA